MRYFQDNVQFAKLGLVIIDEQHRFGVDQRLALRNKGTNHTPPHQLVMTATPIPRTLAMSAYGDLDTSVIDELPPGRTPIQTVTIPLDRREEVLQRIASNCAEGETSLLGLYLGGTDRKPRCTSCRSDFC